MKLNNTYTYGYGFSTKPQKGMRVRVNFNGQNIVGFIADSFDITDLNEYETKVGYKIKMIDELIDEEPVINQELFDLGLWMSKQTISPVIGCFQAMLPSQLKPASSMGSISQEKYVRFFDLDKAKEYGLNTKEVLLSEFKALTSQYRVDKLKKQNDIEIISKEKQASTSELVIAQTPYELTDKQKAAIQTIETTAKQTILLHGVTGSGKTEIYMQLAQNAIQKGKQVLILVPEIALTPQMVKRFSDRFNRNIAIYHSSLSPQEKYRQYRLVQQSKVKIVVGTRSAVFMPFNNLGLVVLDEEHDGSYKQDKVPKYNAKEIAMQRANTHQCKVVLGSATPTLEAYARAVKGVYELVYLDSRINASLPTCNLVNMNEQIRKGNYIISKPLKDAIEQRLALNQQIILLLNRRGYTPIKKCSQCGELMVCPHCDIALSYHKDEDALVCHCCGYKQTADIACPKCGSHRWRNYGVGTQRLVEEVNRFFPQARVLRMDTDNVTKKNPHEQFFEAFAQKQYDILVGTQMISKGLDYPNVTLVGIFDADAPLSRSDYRSVETTFDLIVQASGRSGRAQNKGEVLVQTYDTNHYAITWAIQQNYQAFFNTEMKYRHAGQYPPYSYLIEILFSSKNEQHCVDTAYTTSQFFRENKQYTVLGPAKIQKKRDLIRCRVIIKGKDRQQMISDVWNWYNNSDINKRQVDVQVDVDPYNLD